MKDFNHLNTWLRGKMDERQISVEELAVASTVSRNQLYNWLRDQHRPTSKTMLKVVHALSDLPVITYQKDKRIEQKVKVTIEEGMAQFTSVPLGRPKERDDREARRRRP